MLQFFRNLRRSMIHDYKARYYTLYAIGEILLVVAGILIALQIDNWNEHRKSREYELSMIAEIKKALTNDTTYFEMLLRRLSRSEEGIEKVISYYGDNSVPLDSIQKYLNISRMGILYQFNAGPYEALKSSGIDKISNDSLRIEISEIYDFSLPRTGRLIDYVRQDERMNELRNSLYNTSLITDENGQNQLVSQITTREVLSEPDLAEYLNIKRHYNRNAIGRIESVLNHLSYVINMCSRELGKDES